MSLLTGTIERRIMAAVKAKIKEQQDRYDKGVVELEEEFQVKKEELANALVDAVVSKILS